MTGVSWNTRLVSLRILNSSGEGTVNALEDAIIHAKDKKIPILNASIGNSPHQVALEQAIRDYTNSGGLFVVAAGNGPTNAFDGVNIDNDPDYPASYGHPDYNIPNIIVVGATMGADDSPTLTYVDHTICWIMSPILAALGTCFTCITVTERSNFGSKTVDIYAPGKNIYSTTRDGTYGYKSGSSMAAPMVAGVAALILSVKPDMSADEIKSCILDNVDKSNFLTNYCSSGGRLNAFKAVESITTFITNTTTEGTVTITDLTPAGRAITGIIDIPSEINGNPVTAIGYSAFGDANCAIINIPSSVTNIGTYAFGDCTNLVSVNFTTDSQLVNIGYGAFWNCISLENIIIPSSVINIDGFAFYGSGLTDIAFMEGSQLTEISYCTFSSCTRLRSIIIPSSVTLIDIYAFQDCSSLISITIPANVTQIGGYAFENCSDLESVIFESGSQLMQIWNDAFNNCTSLTSIIIPSSVTNISGSAFSSCTNLTTVYVERRSRMEITTLGIDAFYNCPNLTQIIVPDRASVVEYGNAINWSIYQPLIREAQKPTFDRTIIDIVETGDTTDGQRYIVSTENFELSNLVGSWGGIYLYNGLSTTENCSFTFEYDTEIDGFVMCDYNTPGWGIIIIDVERVYVAGNEFIVQDKSGQEFFFDITGATQIWVSFYGEINATLASKMIYADRLFKKSIDLQLESIELEFYPSWSESNILTIELSNNIRIEIHTTPWASTIIVDIKIYELYGEWYFVGYAGQIEGSKISSGFTGYITIWEDGGRLLFLYNVNRGADYRLFAFDLNDVAQEMQARVSVGNCYVFVSGIVTNDTSQFVFTMPGIDGEVLQVLTLPQSSYMDSRMFEPFLPMRTGDLLSRATELNINLGFTEVHD